MYRYSIERSKLLNKDSLKIDDMNASKISDTVLSNSLPVVIDKYEVSGGNRKSNNEDYSFESLCLSKKETVKIPDRMRNSKGEMKRIYKSRNSVLETIDIVQCK